MTMAVTVAKHQGAQTVICASTGNTSAAAAAYAAKAGMKCVVLVPEGKVAVGKLAASLAYGAQVVEIRGSFDDGLRLVREVADKTPICLVNSVNPARIEGQKTGSFEICDALGVAPDLHALPVGNAGNITAYWKGYLEYHAAGVIAKPPQLLGVQAAGAAPIVHGKVVDHPETKCTAIRIGNPARFDEAVTALKESSGNILAATDEQIFEAYGELAKRDGVFCEPSSAAGVAGLKIAREAGLIDLEGKKVVVILTGHGLKDPDSAMSIVLPPVQADATYDGLMKVIG